MCNGAAVIIILVVFVVAFAIYRNAQDLKLARDEVQAINLTLEERVKTRTADLAMLCARPSCWPPRGPVSS